MLNVDFKSSGLTAIGWTPNCLVAPLRTRSVWSSFFEKARLNGIAELTNSEKSLGLMIQRSFPASGIFLIRPSCTEMLHTFASGRKDCLKTDQLIGSNCCDAPAPNAMVKEMTEMSMCAVPEKSGPHRCK